MQRLSKHARRAQLLEAAASAFVEGGFDGTSMEMVADRAGVTRLIVYRHFESKHALYCAVLDSVVTPLREGYVPDMPGGVGPLLMRVARARPDGFRLLCRHARNEPTFAKQAEAFRQIAAAFADEAIRAHVADRDLMRWFAATLQAGARAMIAAWADPDASR